MTTNAPQNTQTLLKGYVNRIESLTEDKQNIANDIKDVKAEAKSNGIDIKALNEVLKRRKKSKAELDEWDTIVSLYEANL